MSKESQLETLRAEWKAIYARADREGRETTVDEKLYINDLLDRYEQVKAGRSPNVPEIDYDRMGRALGPPGGRYSVTSEPQDRLMRDLNSGMFVPLQKSLGEQFIETKGYREAINAYRESGRLPMNYTSEPQRLEYKGTLSETTAVNGGWGYGAGFVSVPQVVPGVVTTLSRRITFPDLILQGQTDSPSVRFIVEGTAVSGASAVLEGATKGESTLGVQTSDAMVVTIATVLPVTEQMMMDGPAIQSYINGRLSLFVALEEERQLLRGSSASNEVTGIFNQGIPVWAGGTATATGGDRASQFFRSANSMRGSALCEPDWAILHQDDFESLRLIRDSSGNYLGGGPFDQTGAMGRGRMAGEPPTVAGPSVAVWGIPVYVSPLLGKGTALIGTRANAQVWRRAGLMVTSTNSHSDYFVRNLVAVRAESRLALTCYRTGGYVEVHWDATS